MSDSEEDWTPPSEAQMKVIQAKRERSDKISKLMGDYLLKGYKMLATSCSVCSTVELQDRAGLKFCVACQEVDCHETSKDDPALSREAAERVVEEEQYSSTGHDSNVPTPVTTRSQSQAVSSLRNQSLMSSLSITPAASHNIPSSCLQSGARPRAAQSVHGVSLSQSSGAGDDLGVTTSQTEQTLLKQSLARVTSVLDTANQDLETCTNTEKMTQLVVLVREAATTLVTLKQLLCDN